MTAPSIGIPSIRVKYPEPQNDSPEQLCCEEKMRRIGLKNCPYCGSSNVYAAAPKASWGIVPVVFLLRIVRCHTCMRRHLRPLLLPAAKHPKACRVPAKPTQGVSAGQTEKRPALGALHKCSRQRPRLHRVVKNSRSVSGYRFSDTGIVAAPNALPIIGGAGFVEPPPVIAPQPLRVKRVPPMTSTTIKNTEIRNLNITAVTLGSESRGCFG